MSTYVLSLASPDLTLERGGGKAANLSRLARAGLPVPTGFVVTTDAYRAAAAAGPDHQVALALADASADRPESLDAASTRIRSAFERAILPDALAAEIHLAYQALAPDQPAVAVRSSATAEDLPTASFAGQQETYLNVRGDGPLLDAVRRCWASLWTARAMAYRARLGIPPSSVALAVVVQRMVPAEVSGILFTVNPTSGRADEVVIESASGLGEAVVGGRTSPDSLVVDKETGRIRSATIGEKSLRSVPTAGGTMEVEVAPNDRGRLSLTPEQAALLAGLGRDIEDLLGSPQDVEWAIAEGGAHILQSRPVMAAASEDDDWPPLFPPDAAMPYDRWTHADVGERWPDPVIPIALS